MPKDPFLELKARVERLQSAADRAAGVRDAELENLRTKYGCGTIKEAKALLKKTEQEADAAEAAYKKALAKFEEEWGEVLDEHADD